MTQANETTITCLTPPGRGAIATLALVGSRAWEAVRAEFRGRQLPELPVPGSVWYGKIGGDDVIVGVKDDNPPLVEIHCHGGTEIVAYLTDLFKKHDTTPCDWQSFVRHRDGAYKASAQTELAKATTLRTASILLDQYHGAFQNAVTDVVELLKQKQIDNAEIALSAIAQYEGVGRHLTNPWKIVIAGAPNVGKSSLVNALAGFERAVVSPIAGTTRDVVSTTLALDGWPVEVFDTAGWRRRAETLEQQGIAKASAAMVEADLCLWVVDGSAEPQWPEQASDNFLFVVNKIDLPAAWDRSQHPDAVCVSAKTRDGVAALCDIIANTLVPNPPPPNAAVPFTGEYCDRVHRVLTALRANDIADAIQILHPLAG